VPGQKLGLSVQQVESYQRIHNNGPYILNPVGPQQQLTKFLIDTGAQISILTQQDAEKRPNHSFTTDMRTQAEKCKLVFPFSKILQMFHWVC